VPDRRQRGAHKDGCGRCRRLRLIFRDVSERRRLELTEAKRLEAARFLASIVESSEDAIVSKSLDGTIQTWNAAAERLFGYTAAEAIGRHISLVIPADRATEEDAHHCADSIRRARRSFRNGSPADGRAARARLSDHLANS
jgi:PAS domain S-box-containing protein